MTRLLVLAALAVLVFRMITGRWPWEKRLSAHVRAISDARRLLGVEAHASRAQIAAAHKKLIATVHPDRGGSAEQVHEANAARDLLVNELPGRIESEQE